MLEWQHPVFECADCHAHRSWRALVRRRGAKIGVNEFLLNPVPVKALHDHMVSVLTNKGRLLRPGAA
jgi:hypothetical protein